MTPRTCTALAALALAVLAGATPARAQDAPKAATPAARAADAPLPPPGLAPVAPSTPANPAGTGGAAAVAAPATPAAIPAATAPLAPVAPAAAATAVPAAPPAPSAAPARTPVVPPAAAATPVVAAGPDASASAPATPTAAPGAASAPADAASAPSLDERVQATKNDVIQLNRDLLALEEELLFPANTQVAVFVSMDVGLLFDLDSLQLRLDDKLVTSYLYTPQEVQALHRGGMQRVYLGNLKAGPHEIVAFFTGKGPHDRDYKRGTTVRFEKTTAPEYIELQIVDDAQKLQPDFNVKIWQ